MVPMKKIAIKVREIIIIIIICLCDYYYITQNVLNVHNVCNWHNLVKLKKILYLLNNINLEYIF